MAAIGRAITAAAMAAVSMLARTARAKAAALFAAVAMRSEAADRTEVRRSVHVISAN